MSLSDVFNAKPNPKYSGKGGRRSHSAFDSPLIRLSLAWAKFCGKTVMWFGSKFAGLFRRKKKYSPREMGWHRWD